MRVRHQRLLLYSSDDGISQSIRMNIGSDGLIGPEEPLGLRRQ
jgi:hypothetical protein